MFDHRSTQDHRDAATRARFVPDMPQDNYRTLDGYPYAFTSQVDRAVLRNRHQRDLVRSSLYRNGDK